VLRPPDRVDDPTRPLAPRVADHRLGDLDDLLRRDAAHAGDQLGRIAAEVALEEPQDAARMLEGLVELASLGGHPRARHLGERLRRVLAHAGGERRIAAAAIQPRRRVVHPRRRVEPREHAAEILGVPEALVDDGGRVRIAQDVLAKPRAGLEHVVDEAAKEGDVGARAYRDVLIAHRARAREARVDVDHASAALARLHHPTKADRVGLGHRGALDQ
jgi:hypothetical protein